ncbi:unnamed protein product [Acanthoscelides obtectus]|uniref:Carbohydrate kinase FGGY C-terminal domain-containing protein n=1 Tax=Acanthoscelides obtectus TaxID=200917 RepID=A0A9P0K7A2_ACAOB|nr:unnamed protein product [Acanthoscelides obtectus]CAK1658229.1 Putative glycerol kinase 5 [Acanthoscelides obtectus]
MPPISNENAGTGFIGIKPTTRREHIVRAVLESIVYRMVLCYDLLKSERNANYNSIRVDGGLSNSSFICQSLADMSRLPVTKMETTDITVLGVAYLSGLKCGFWSNKEDLTKLKKVTESFEPTRDQNKIEMNKNNLNLWIRAARRFYSWY